MILADTPTPQALAARVLLDALFAGIHDGREKTRDELIVEVFLWEQMGQPELAAIISMDIE